MQRIIAIDQSTSSTKALLFDEQCKVVARTNVDHKQYYPQTGWVEHDAEEIYQNMIEAIRMLMSDVRCQKEDVTFSARRLWYGTKRWASPLPMRWCGRIPVVLSCAVSFVLRARLIW